MEQVEEICDKIVLINKGKNVLFGTVKEIKQNFKENLFRIDYEGTLPEMNNGISFVEQTPQYLTLKLNEGTDSNVLLRHLLDSGTRVTAFNEILPTLNEIFIRQVGETN
jgi:ABC-2 type transport system ATP-binding protein